MSVIVFNLLFLKKQKKFAQIPRNSRTESYASNIIHVDLQKIILPAYFGCILTCYIDYTPWDPERNVARQSDISLSPIITDRA